MNVNENPATAVRGKIGDAIQKLSILPAEAWRVTYVIDTLTVVATPPAPGTSADVGIYRMVGKRETERDLTRLTNVFD